MPLVACRGRGRTHIRTGRSAGRGHGPCGGRPGAGARAIPHRLRPRPPGTRAHQRMPFLQSSPGCPDSSGRGPSARCPQTSVGMPVLPSRRRTAQPFRGRPRSAARRDGARLGRPPLSRLTPRAGRRAPGPVRSGPYEARRAPPPRSGGRGLPRPAAQERPGRPRGRGSDLPGPARDGAGRQGLVRRRRGSHPGRDLGRGERQHRTAEPVGRLPGRRGAVHRLHEPLRRGRPRQAPQRRQPACVSTPTTRGPRRVRRPYWRSAPPPGPSSGRTRRTDCCAARPTRGCASTRTPRSGRS